MEKALTPPVGWPSNEFVSFTANSRCRFASRTKNEGLGVSATDAQRNQHNVLRNFEVLRLKFEQINALAFRAGVRADVNQGRIRKTLAVGGGLVIGRLDGTAGDERRQNQKCTDRHEAECSQFHIRCVVKCGNGAENTVLLFFRHIRSNMLSPHFVAGIVEMQLIFNK